MRGKSWPEHQGRKEGEVKLLCVWGGGGLLGNSLGVQDFLMKSDSFHISHCL